MDSEHITKNEQITFTVSADVVWNFFGNYINVASTSAGLVYSIIPPKSIPDINILKNVKDSTNEDFLNRNNINPNTPQLISLTESLDDPFSNSNNILIKKLCIRGYENIENIRFQ